LRYARIKDLKIHKNWTLLHDADISPTLWSHELPSTCSVTEQSVLLQVLQSCCLATESRSLLFYLLLSC
jgi:hypothetical protein